MKYLKLYEAFQSKGISNTVKFLKSKIGSENTNKFLSSLKVLLDKSNYPIDKLSDNDIKYMNAKKALQLKNEEDVENLNELWVIKYWFSLEKGFLGYTGTGNTVFDYNSRNTSDGIKDEQLDFSDSDLNYIKQNITRTGEYWPVKDYNQLKTGDKVLLFCGDYRRESYLTMATIFKDSEDRYYVIQDVNDGSEPHSSGWRVYGRRSWYIYEPGQGIGNDHSSLHLFKPSSEELHKVEPPKNEEDEGSEIEKNPLDWNLPLSYSLNIRRWGRGESIDSEDEIKNADFAIVLYYDNLINTDSNASHFEPVSDKRLGRREDKKGALALMTDDSIKKENLERYISKLSNNIDISIDDIKNLQKIAIKSLLSEYSLISIYRGIGQSEISQICTYLYDIIKCAKSGDTENAQYYVNRVKDYYSDLNKKYYRNIQYYNLCKSESKKSVFEDILNEFYSIGLEISNWVRNQKIDTIDDLFIISHKITTIRDFMTRDINRLSYQLRNLLGEFGDISSFKYYINDYSQHDEKEFDLQKTERIKKYIKSILN